MPDALAFLADQFSRDEAQETADAVADQVAKDAPAGGGALTVRWAIEEAVLNAFGFSSEDDDGD
jgi:hypothetical protein